MAQIFVSYRRDDTSGYSGRLSDFLIARFGRDSMFMDLDTIRGGDDFTAVIEEKIALCDILLAVMGPKWLTITNAEGTRRIDDADDFVRLEVRRSLERGIRVIPVLVGGARMPRPAELPEDLRAFSLRQAVELRDQYFRTDAERLMDLLDGVGSSGRFARLRRGPWKWLAGAALLALAVLIITLRVRSAKPDFAQPTKVVGLHEASPQTAAPAPPPASGSAASAIDKVPRPALPKKALSFAGRWTGTVTYDWRNAIYEESFDLRVSGDEVTGTASFVGVDQGIFDGKVEGNRVSFMTKTRTMRGMDNSLHVDKHYYKGSIQGDSIRFSMQTDSELEAHVPVYFSVRRAPAK